MGFAKGAQSILRDLLPYLLILTALNGREMPNKYRFTVGAAGADRNLFSVLERKNGDLTIGFGFALRYESDESNPDIKHQKYSVHVSPNSQKFNTVKHELWLNDGTKLTSSFLTDAVKSKSGFHPIFCRRCPDLTNDRYLVAPDDKAKLIKLTGCKLAGTFFYGVFVGSTDSVFGAHPGVDVMEIAFSCFKIVVLSHHLLLPPNHRGKLLHTMTEPPEHPLPEVQFHLREAMRGKTAAFCATYFKEASMKLGIEMAAQVRPLLVDPEHVAHLAAFVDYARTELETSKSGIVWLEASPSRAT
jgi:hypothetical protein